MLFALLHTGSFIEFNLETPTVTTPVDMDVMLSCSITYSTPQDSQDAMPVITWSSGLTGVDLSAQSYQVRGTVTWESVLNLTNLNSSYCGSYTCSASDSRVAQPTTANAQVQVGEKKLY